MARSKRKKQFSVIRSLNEVNTTEANGSHVSIIMIVIFIIACLMIGFIWQKVKINQLVAQIDELQKQELVLKERNEKKRAKVLNLSNDSRIIKIAEKKLGMIFPSYEVISTSDLKQKKLP